MAAPPRRSRRLLRRLLRLTFGEMVKLVISPCEQLRMMSATPLLDATLVGKRVAVRIVDIGWCAGKVCHRSSSAAVQSYNYAVRYDADDVQLHWLTEARYAGSSKANAASERLGRHGCAACRLVGGVRHERVTARTGDRLHCCIARGGGRAGGFAATKAVRQAACANP